MTDPDFWNDQTKAQTLKIMNAKLKSFQTRGKKVQLQLPQIWLDVEQILNLVMVLKS